MDDPQSFGQWLRHRRRELDLTQDALARQVGCAQVTIRKLEADDIRPSKQLAELLVDQLGVSPAEHDAYVRFGRGGLPPGHVLAAPSHNLPLHSSSFIGRERELAAVQQALQQSRLVTLTGPGGMGKTRLALQTASQLLPTYPDGVWWVELAALQAPALVGQAVAKAAGVSEVANQLWAETLAHAFRAQHLLLVLDNCEHLVAACAELAERLLSACHQVKILATSREVLDIAGETAWPVPALALPDRVEPMAMTTLSRVESIRLFAERARAAQPKFDLVEQNAPAVVRICRRLSGMPLAIELAAARARMMSVEEIARRLDDRFDLLTTGSRTALPRHQTLRATIDWSFDLLSEPERMLFRRLSVFAGSFSLAAAEAVAAGGTLSPAQVVDQLGQLINKSLVTVDERSPSSPAETRYGMLETIHEYARQKCEQAGEADDLRERHLEFFTALAEQAGQGIKSADQAAWFQRLDQEVDNLRAAISWPIAGASANDLLHRSRQKCQLRIIGSLAMYWGRGNLREVVETLETILAGDRPGEPSLERAKALYTGGFVRFALGQLAEARAYLEESIEVAEKLGDPLTLAWSLSYLGWTFDSLGDYDSARSAYERSVAIGQALGDDGQRAAGQSLGLLGDLPYRQGNWPAARQCYERAIAFLREHPNNNDLAYDMRHLAFVTLREGSPERMVELLRQSLALNRELGHFQGIVACLAGFAAFYLALGHPAPAAVLCGCVENLLQRKGVPLYSVDNIEYERSVAQLKAMLEPGTMAAAWASGRAMGMDEAIDYALDEEPVTLTPDKQRDQSR